MLVTISLITLIASFFFSTLIITSTNMSKSYDTVMKNGNVHDFTIDENYILPNGELKLNSELGSGDDAFKFTIMYPQGYTLSIPSTFNNVKLPGTSPGDV
jgi:hypothetical protein